LHLLPPRCLGEAHHDSKNGSQPNKTRKPFRRIHGELLIFECNFTYSHCKIHRNLRSYDLQQKFPAYSIRQIFEDQPRLGMKVSFLSSEKIKDNLLLFVP